MTAELRARRLEVGVGAAAMNLPLTVGSGFWVVQQQRFTARERRLRTDREVEEMVEQGRVLLGEAWPAHDQIRLSAAGVAADRAVDVARRGAASAPVTEQAAAFQAEAQERLRRLRKNDDLREALMSVWIPHESSAHKDADERLRRSENRNGLREALKGIGPLLSDVDRDDPGGLPIPMVRPSIDEQYCAAFRSWGLDVDGAPEAEAAARLQAEPNAVVQDLIAALDSWMLHRRKMRTEARWPRLFRIVDQLDHNAERRQLRALMVSDASPRAESVAGLLGAGAPWPALWALGRGNKWQQVRQLREPMTPQTPVLTVLLLAQACEDVGDAAAAEEVLRQALAVRPRQVVLWDALGKLLEQQGPSRLAETIACYRTIRVQHPSLGLKLAQLLIQAGKPREAELVLTALVDGRRDNLEIRVALGIAFYDQGKPNKAELVFQQGPRTRARSGLAALQPRQRSEGTEQVGRSCGGTPQGDRTRCSSRLGTRQPRRAVF